MRIGIFSDVHGNLQALEATLGALEKRRVDRLVCLGDVASLGLQPREVIERLRKTDCRFLLGNHESALLFPEQHERFRIPAFLMPCLTWCREQIGETGIDFLRTFSATETFELNEHHTLLAFHGSPASNIETFDLFDRDSLDAVGKAFPRANVFAGGHTHTQLLQRFKQFSFLNPGSAGSVFKVLPFEGPEPMLLPLAEFAILEANGPELLVESHRIPFPTDSINEIASRSTYPMKDWWAKQFP